MVTLDVGIKNKVLVIHNNYRGFGGECAAVVAQVQLLQQYGHCVISYRRNSTEIQNYRPLQKLEFFPKAIFSWKTYKEIRALVADKHPNIAHVHNVFPLISPSVYQALRDSGIPIVQTVHNFRFMCPNGLFYTQGHVCERCKSGHTFHAVWRRCYQHSYVLSALYACSIGWSRFRGFLGYIDRFIALTAFTNHKLVESGLTTQEKITTLGHFLPAPLPDSGSFQKREPYIVYLGRLSPEKGINILLDAMVGIPDLHLKIAGDGPQASSLCTFVKERNLTKIEFLGHIDGNQKWALLRNAIALVVPSVCYETFGLVVLESLAVGTPVIASNFGSLPYLVENNKTGLLFSKGDVESLRQKLLWASINSDAMLSMGRCSRQTVEKHYSAETHYEQLMKVYASVL